MICVVRGALVAAGYDLASPVAAVAWLLIAVVIVQSATTTREHPHDRQHGRAD